MKRVSSLANNYKLGILSFVVSLGILLPQVSSVASGYADSDEFLLISQNLSVAHPPGYGAMSILAYLFNQLIFWGSTAFAGNLLAAIISASSISLLVLASVFLTQELTHHKKLALPTKLAIAILPLLLLTSGIFAIYATILEVTSLTAMLFMATLLSVFVTYLKNFNRTWLIISSILFGVSVSHYQPMILISPALIYLGWIKLQEYPKREKVKHCAIALGMFFSAFILPYLAIFAINSTKPNTSWYFDQSVSGLANLILRKDYSGYFLDDGVQRSAYFGAGFIAKFMRSQIPYWHMMLEQVGLPLLGLSILGLVVILKKNLKLGVFFVLLWFIVGPLFIGFLGTPIPSPENISYPMSLGIFQRQLILSLSLTTLLATIGAGLVIEMLNIKKYAMVYGVSISAVLLLLLAQSASANRHLFNAQRKELIPDYIHSMLESAKPDSVIICGSDMACFGLLYATEVEAIRPDVTILTTNPIVKRYFLQKNPEYYPFAYVQNPFFLANLITWNASERTTYLTSPSSFYIEYVGLHGDPYYLVPHDFLFEVTLDIPESLAMPDDAYINQVLATPIAKTDWFMRGFKDYLANSTYFSGVLASHLDQKQVAQAYLDQALSLKPDYAEVTDWLTKLYTPGMIASYTTASVQDRDYYAKFQEFLRDQKLDDAYAQLLKALYLDPKNQPLRLELAKLYLRGNFTDLAQTEIGHLSLFGPIEASIAAQVSGLIQN